VEEDAALLEARFGMFLQMNQMPCAKDCAAAVAAVAALPAWQQLCASMSAMKDVKEGAMTSGLLARAAVPLLRAYLPAATTQALSLLATCLPSDV